ncbi:MAG: hypothetical protein AAF389_01065 [Gemmatimonadota bacterium]
MIRRIGGIGLAAALLAAPLSGQTMVASGVDYLGYSFDNGLGADAAQLLLIPVAARFPLSNSATLDVFAAWAEGKVEQNNTQLTLSGPVDTGVKLSLAATPWAMVSVSANVPTGHATHTAEEAVVASILSTDILSFRETNWGTGLAITTSVATATRAGGFGLGVAAAYAARSGFEPSDGVALEYTPGNEVRIRAGLDRNFGNSTLTAGATFVQYSEDQVAEGGAAAANLFQAGNRLRFDASLAFRAGSGVWTIYGADLIRSNGDLFVDVLDGGGAVVGTTSVMTAKQNLLIGGIIGSVGLGGGFVFRPHVDVKVQTREEADGSTAGSGWMLAAGGDIPFRVFGSEFFPKARVYFGGIEDLTGATVSTLGAEFKGTLRLHF